MTDRFVSPRGSRYMVDRDGRRYSVPDGEVDEKLKRGWQIEGAEATQAAGAAAASDDPMTTFVESFFDTATAGLSTSLEKNIGGRLEEQAGLGGTEEDVAAGIKARREQNPIASGAGVVAGAVMPWGVGGAASKLGAKVGEGVAARVGTGFGGRLVAKGAAGAAEGAVFGLGQGAGELALSTEPPDLETYVTVLGSNALYGAAFGGGIGTTGQLLKEGAIAGKSLASRWAQKVASKAPEAEAGGLKLSPGNEDLGKLVDAGDLQGLKKAGEVERGNLNALRQQEKQVLADDIVKYRNESYGKDYWNSALRGAEKEKAAARDPYGTQKIKGQAGKTVEEPTFRPGEGPDTQVDIRAASPAPAIEEQVSPRILRGKFMAAKKADMRLRAITDNPLALADDPLRALEPLQRQHEALKVMLTDPMLMQSRGEVIQQVLQKNEALMARLQGLKVPPASQRMVDIDNAIDALKLGLRKPPRSMAGDMVRGLAAAKGYALGGPIGGVVAYRLGSALGEAVDRGGLGALARKLKDGVQAGKVGMAKSVDKFFKTTGKVAKAAPSATKVMMSVRYALPGDAARSRIREYAKPPSDLVRIYREREDEIRSQVSRDMVTGKYTMRLQARMALHERLAGLWAVDPMLADKVETLAAARISYLASKLPTRKVQTGIMTGPDRWHPSDMEMRKFARIVDAVEHPEHIMERAADGTMTPDEADVLRELYPGLHRALVTEVVQRLPQLRAQLPFKQRLMLSMLTGVPVDTALEPTVLAVLQGNFADPMGQPAEPQAGNPIGPNYGAMKKSVPQPTPAQRLTDK